MIYVTFCVTISKGYFSTIDYKELKKVTKQQINTSLTNDISYTEGGAVYDENFKKFLSRKKILAWIMKECLWEFENIPVTEIAEKYIEGIPEVGKAQVFDGEKIQGLPTEVITANNGKIFYDIRYRTLAPNGDDIIEFIVNVEAQNKYYTGYPLIKRGLFYSSQMISNQYGTEFEKMDYNKLKKVYSIWLVHNVPKKLSNSITRYDISETNILGQMMEKRENYDLISVVMVYLGKDQDHPQSKMLNLLKSLLSQELDGQAKTKILEEEYDIPRTQELEEELEHMCNISKGFFEDGIEQGEYQKAVDIAKKGLKNKISLEIISVMTGFTISEIEELNTDKMRCNIE